MATDSRRRPSYFPHRASGFRANPFRVLAPEEQAQAAVLPAGAEPEGIEDLWTRGDHLQILGEAGRGKSTVLLALASRAEASGKSVAYEHVPEGRRTYTTRVPGLDGFFLDEADRLGCLAWCRLLRAARRATCRIFIGCHRDQSYRFAQRGMVLKTLRLGETPGAEFLRRILERRLSLAAIPGSPPPRFGDDSVAWLLQRFGGDLRSLERFLYFFFQEPCDQLITARSLAAFAGAMRVRPHRHGRPAPARKGH